MTDSGRLSNAEIVTAAHAAGLGHQHVEKAMDYVRAGMPLDQAISLAALRAGRFLSHSAPDCQLLNWGVPAEMLLEWVTAYVATAQVVEAVDRGMSLHRIMRMPAKQLETVSRFLPVAAQHNVDPATLEALMAVDGWTLDHLELLGIGYLPDDLAALSAAGAHVGLLSAPAGQVLDWPVSADPQERQLELLLMGAHAVPHAAAVTLVSLLPAGTAETMKRLLIDGMSVPAAAHAAIALEGKNLASAPAVDRGLRVSRPVTADSPGHDLH